MRSIAIVIILTTQSVSFCFADVKSKIPIDVAKFIERRDLCDHFRGEEPYDEKRRLFLEKNTIEYCTGTDKELATLKLKYKNNRHIIEKLETYEDKIEASSLGH